MNPVKFYGLKSKKKYPEISTRVVDFGNKSNDSLLSDGGEEDDEILKYKNQLFDEEKPSCSKNISEEIGEYEMSSNSSSSEEEIFEKKNMKTVSKKSKNKIISKNQIETLKSKKKH